MFKKVALIAGLGLGLVGCSALADPIQGFVYLKDKPEIKKDFSFQRSIGNYSSVENCELASRDLLRSYPSDKHDGWACGVNCRLKPMFTDFELEHAYSEKQKSFMREVNKTKVCENMLAEG